VTISSMLSTGSPMDAASRSGPIRAIYSSISGRTGAGRM
jgi:hypothetical protein